MSPLVLNLLSGLVGALLGAMAAILAVRYSHVVQAKASLRGLLVAQRIALQSLASEQVGAKLSSDYVSIYSAYQNLRSLYPRFCLGPLKRAWRNYKGNYGDYTLLFGLQSDQGDASRQGVTSGQFDRDSAIARLDVFLKHLGAR